MLLRNKVYSAINIVGLSLGIGVCLLIYQYIQFELSYDRFHPNAENTYRIRLDHYQNESLVTSEVLTPSKLGSSVSQTFPEIEQMVRIRPMLEDEGVVIQNPENSNSFLEYNLYYVDQSFFEMFNYDFISGDQTTALNDLKSIILTEKTATKFFGTTDAAGKVLQIKGGSLSGDFVVTGVLKNLPSNTHLDFDFLLPLDFLLHNYGIYSRSNGWKWYNFYTYLTINQEVNPELISKKIDQVIQLKNGTGLQDDGNKIRSGLQALTDIHLKSNFQSDLSRTSGNLINIWFYSLVGFVILIIVWVNFINLSTAQAIDREKEVASRKCLGAYKKQLIFQFFTESILINIIASGLGCIVAILLLPFLSQILGKDIGFTLFESTPFPLSFLSFIFVSAILSGLYPAFILSSYKPTSIFQNKAPKGTSLILRKSLIGLQFLVSILLIAGTYVVYKQIHFMKSHELGVDMENIIVVPGPRVVLEGDRDLLPIKYKTFKSNIINHPSIASVTGTSNIPGKGVKWYGDMRKLGAPNEAYVEGKAILVDANFTDTYDFEFLAGDEFTSDMGNYSGVIINEKAVEEFQLGSPKEAIGQSVIMGKLDTLKILGVIKNVHWSSLSDPIMPTIFSLDEYNAYFSIRANMANIPKTINHIASTYHKAFPNDPFEYYFLDELFNKQYQAEQQFGKLFTGFTFLAVLLACIGLFAMVSFSFKLRTKEIGIRKVLGASVESVLGLLSKEYLILFMVALCISVPVIWIGTNTWLENYAYRIEFSSDIFIIPTLLLLIITSLTVGYKALSSANNNPVDALRIE
tara:strand:+ start:63938 stop:66346 length:2409 start_codon:yes stop_codon:yes gene_type:complete